MRKRPSRRRIKARLLNGQKVGWMWIVEHDLRRWAPGGRKLEREFDSELAYLLKAPRTRPMAPLIYTECIVRDPLQNVGDSHINVSRP